MKALELFLIISYIYDMYKVNTAVSKIMNLDKGYDIKKIKLFSLALKQIPGSPNQKKVIEAMDFCQAKISEGKTNQPYSREEFVQFGQAFIEAHEEAFRRLA